MTARASTSAKKSHWTASTRMQPTSETSAAHTDVSVDLTVTLDDLPAGDRTQRLGLARLQALHKTYTQGVRRVFAAVDAGELDARRASSTRRQLSPPAFSFEAAIYADSNQQALINGCHDPRPSGRHARRVARHPDGLRNRRTGTPRVPTNLT